MTQAQASSGQPAGATLGAFITQSRFADVPAAVTREAKRSVLNLVGTCLGGRRDPAVPRLIDVLRPFSGNPEAVVIGQPDRLDMLNAALVNAVAGNTLEFDDTHQPTVIHPTAPVLPPIMALADHQQVSGKDLLHAFALGVDVACRVGNSVTPGHYRAAGTSRRPAASSVPPQPALACLAWMRCRSRTRSASPRARRRASSRTCRPEPRTSASAMPPATACWSAILAAKGYNAAPRAIEGPLGLCQGGGGHGRSQRADG